MTDQPYDALLYIGRAEPARQWARNHQIPTNRVIPQTDVSHLRGFSRVLVIHGEGVVTDETEQTLGPIPFVTVWDGSADTLDQFREPPVASTRQLLIHAHIEVAPEPGGWTVTEYTGQAKAPNPRVLVHTRTKRVAMLIGRGAALVWKCDLRVKNRQGRYTTASTNYGDQS
jgi:hypothetical protein